MGNEPYDFCFAGSGGQGMILTSIIFAEAALLSGRKAVQSQVYGPEARGGSCRGETVISGGDIWYSKPSHPNFLLALSQPALDQYAGQVQSGGVILYDAELTPPAVNLGVRLVKLPVLSIAREEIKNPLTTNIVAAGAINALLNLFSAPVMEEAVRRHVPARMEQLNLRALEAGRRMALQAAA